MKLFTAILISFLVLIPPSFPQSAKKEKKDQKKAAEFEKVIELLEGKEFKFVGRTALPQGRPSVDITTRGNLFSVNQDALNVDLSYFGTLHQGGYGSSGGGLTFEQPATDHVLKVKRKKGRFTVVVKTTNDSEFFTFTLSGSGAESATLSVIGSRRQGISYFGSIEPLN